MNGCEINKGEIWEVESNVGIKLVVVLNCYEKYAATVILQEQEPASNAVPVRARSIMYADAGRLGYVFYDKMVDFVRALSADEDRELRAAIAAALELGEINQGAAVMAVELQEAATAAATAKLEAARQEIVILREELAEAAGACKGLEVTKKEADRLRKELEATQKETASLRKQLEEASLAAGQDYIELVEEHCLREDLAVVRREAEIYKGLYEDMLARALG